MALLFDATGELVDVGTMGSWSPTVFSAFGWFYPTATNQSHGIFAKGNLSSPFQRIDFCWRRNAGQAVFTYTRSTTTLTYTWSPHPFTVDTWNFFALAFDSGGSANALCKLYVGSLTTAPSEATPSANDDGSGTYTSVSTYAMRLGCASPDEPLTSHLANIAFIDGAAWTAQEFMRPWIGQLVTARRGYWELGYAGTGTQPDWSGNGYAGTVTGATVSAHVPRGHPFAWIHPEGDEYVVSGGTVYQITPAGVLVPTSTLAKHTNKVYLGGLTPAGVLGKSVTKPGLSGSLTPSGTTAKQVAVQVAGALTPSGSMSALRVLLRTFAGAIVPAGALARSMGKTLTGAIIPTGATAKTVAVVLAGVLTPIGALSKLTQKLWAGLVGLAGSLATLITGGIAPSVVEITGSYQPTLELTGSSAPTVTLTGADESTITITGRFDG